MVRLRLDMCIREKGKQPSAGVQQRREHGAGAARRDDALPNTHVARTSSTTPTQKHHFCGTEAIVYIQTDPPSPTIPLELLLLLLLVFHG